MNNSKCLSTIACGLAVMCGLSSFAAEEGYKIELDMSNPARVVKSGEPIEFTGILKNQGNAVPDAPLTYALEGDDSVAGQHQLKTGADGKFTIRTKLDHPGFVRALVTYKMPDNKLLQQRIGVGVDPEKITTARQKPADFDAYWDKIVADMKKMPLNAEVKQVEVTNPNYKDRIDMYDIKLNTPGDKPFVYGYLCIPKNARPKSLPIVMSYQGAGFRSSSQTLFKASQGKMVLDISAHGLPNGQSAEFYANAGKENEDFRARGSNSRDTIYFRGMIIRALRALQYMKSRPEWDGKIVIVSGGSQGGAQSLAVAGLDPDVTFCFAGVPGLADHGGEVSGREGGWPRILRITKKSPESITACDYIDTAFFASRIKNAECLLSVGFFDFVCTPSSVYAAYNAISSPKKRIINDINSDHSMPMATHAEGEKAITNHIKAMNQ